MDAAARHPQYSFFGSRMLMADSPHLLDGVGDVYHVSGPVTFRRNHRSSSPEYAGHVIVVSNAL